MILCLPFTRIVCLTQSTVAKILGHDSSLDKYAGVWMPDALAKKYPNQAMQLGWQYLFPASKMAIDPQSHLWRRHHVDVSGLNKALKIASQKAGISKHITCHTLRHSFATHLLQQVANIRIMQEQLGHVDIKTTQICIHVIKRGGHGVRSPLAYLATI